MEGNVRKGAKKSNFTCFSVKRLKYIGDKLFNMLTKRIILSAILFALLFATCKPKEKEPENPCDNPKTVSELLVCANTVGKVKKDSIQIKLGSDLNEGCAKAWNDRDTVLILSYHDSISLWRVNEKENTLGNYMGSWFTNYSALDSGLTKVQTLNRFALNPCPNDSLSWSNCTCSISGPEPVDAVIRYEEHIKLGPNQQLEFGVVGKSPFGKGGEMQWHTIKHRTPPYRLLEQIRWK